MNCLCGRRRAAGGQVHDGLLVHVRPGDLALEGAVVTEPGRRSHTRMISWASLDAHNGHAPPGRRRMMS